MTAPLPDAALAAIEARAAKAREMVAALCLPKGMDGARDWVMSVPAQPSRDPDLILDAALADIPALLAEVRRLREALAGLVAADIYVDDAVEKIEALAQARAALGEASNG